MPDVVIADASCLIILSRIGELELHFPAGCECFIEAIWGRINGGKHRGLPPLIG
jgi:hypothetical protein